MPLHRQPACKFDMTCSQETIETYYQIGVLYRNFHFRKPLRAVLEYCTVYLPLLILSVFVSCGKEGHISLNEIGLFYTS